MRLTKYAGLNLLPRPDCGGPVSISQEDGASTEVMGSFVSSRALITAGNGSRTSPEKLKPCGDKHYDVMTIRIQNLTKDGIHDVICRFHSRHEVVHKCDL